MRTKLKYDESNCTKAYIYLKVETAFLKTQNLKKFSTLFYILWFI